MFRLTPYTGRQVVRSNRDGNDFYKMMDSFFEDPFFTRRIDQDTFKIDIKDLEDHYLIEADLPGIKKEDVKLGFDKGILTISVESSEEKEEEEDQYIHRERRFSSMKRQIRLKHVDDGSFEAKLDQGVLTVKALKLKEEKTHKEIEIH